MNTLEERINDLEARLLKLEKKEKMRQTLSIIKTIIVVVIMIGMIIFGFFAYKKIRDTIEPIYKITDEYNGSNWLEDVEDYLNGIR